MGKWVVVLRYTDTKTGEECASPYGWMGKVEVLDTWEKAKNYYNLVIATHNELSLEGTIHIEPAEDHADLIMKKEIEDE